MEQIQEEFLDRKPPGCHLSGYPEARTPLCHRRLGKARVWFMILSFAMQDLFFSFLFYCQSNINDQIGAKENHILSSFLLVLALTLSALRHSSPRSEDFLNIKKRLSEKAHSYNLPKCAHFNLGITEAPNYPQTNTLSLFKESS